MNHNPHKCTKCKIVERAKEETGQIFGTVEILGLDHIEEKPRKNDSKVDYYIYYKTKCTKCNKESVRLRNIS